ncbi:dihydrofolate reductase-like domain-containing protein [Aspergillus cavernicola]|uniref:Dihydrofolate reductase n=1 Tax=Aspergillus cavernicola TaxID=176166 RepID=A0ABR4IYG8_9EURO
MPPPPPLPITLIVATTPQNATSSAPSRLGIGLNGTLPWPRIKTDMSFFARVTSRPRARINTPGSGSGSGGNGGVKTNAIIMGRKTYESVPQRLRPLGKRVNVVVSRDNDGKSVGGMVRGELKVKREREREREVAATKAGSTTPTGGSTATGPVEEGQTDAFVSSSLEGALSTLDRAGQRGEVGGVFVIGGAEIYAASLRLRGGDGVEFGGSSTSTITTTSSSSDSSGEKRTVRIVMTDVERVDGGVFECDTFFPVDGEGLKGEGWRRVSAAEVTEWVGEEVSGEWMEEGDVRVRMVGYERVDL